MINFTLCGIWVCGTCFVFQNKNNVIFYFNLRLHCLVLFMYRPFGLFVCRMPDSFSQPLLVLHYCYISSIKTCLLPHTVLHILPSVFPSTEYVSKHLHHQDVFGKWHTLFFFGQQWFSPWTSAIMSLLSRLCLTVDYWTLTLTDEACSFLDVLLGSFETIWISRCCPPWVIFVGRPPFTHSNFHLRTILE